MNDNYDDVKLEVDSKVKVFICSVCEKGYMFKSNLHEHLRSHFGKKPYKCPLCGISIEQKDLLDNHISFHINGKIYKCSSCDEEFPLQSLLQKHLSKHHNNVLYHQKLARRPSCNICQKTFQHNYALKEHCHTHSGEKPYVCELCQKAFKYKFALKVHYRSHTGEKPYVCDVCQKGYSLKNNLLIHRRAHHTIPRIKKKNGITFELLTCETVAKTEKKSFPCHVCQKVFRLQSELSLHLRKHAGGNPFICDVCKEGFSGKFELFKHLRTHSV